MCKWFELSTFTRLRGEVYPGLPVTQDWGCRYARAGCAWWRGRTDQEDLGAWRAGYHVQESTTCSLDHSQYLNIYYFNYLPHYLQPITTKYKPTNVNRLLITDYWLLKWLLISWLLFLCWRWICFNFDMVASGLLTFTKLRSGLRRPWSLITNTLLLITLLRYYCFIAITLFTIQ